MKTLRIRSTNPGSISLREAVTRALNCVSRAWRGDAIVTTNRDGTAVTVNSDILVGEVTLRVVQDAQGTSIYHGETLALRLEGDVLIVDDQTIAPLRRIFWRPQ